VKWAAINNQYAACAFLINAGADVNARGGVSVATPAMWAAQRCHYYVVNLLMQAGTDPMLVDGQGLNIVHLATIDGNSFLLTLLLHQEIPVDVTDSYGHTSLMWAAFKGYPACTDLLLRWGANVNATDEKGQNSLHWALCRGSHFCIQKIIEYGADRFAATAEGKTMAMTAEHMRTTRIFHRALSETGYDADGNPKALPFGLNGLVKDRRVMAKFYFLWPFLVLWAAIALISDLSVYAGVPISFLVSFALQYFATYTTRWGVPEYRQIQQTPFLAGVFASTLFWVGVRWLFAVFPTTFTGHPFLNIVFAACYCLTTYFYSSALLEDPGFVPKLPSRQKQKKVIEELLSLWKFDEDNFCVQCMVRKPLRSKHCLRCGRCVAKQDQ
jgi:palmitoyltransferase ZDHHC13/17